MTKTDKSAISPTRQEDFPEWYQQVIKAADLAENSPVRGCMVIKPTGYAIWEKIKNYLDKFIKDTGHENAYFPLFIPVSFLEKEAAHVDGFAKECAVVTHHRLEEKEGKLVPTSPLEEPLVVRPTSEAIIGDAFSRWISSYRDLPLLINQWANVVRWEMRPRIFLRTSEFLWQEGHTAHATEAEAVEETEKMLGVYRHLLEDYLAIPVIVGEKSPGERFPGAVKTLTLEAMMQDRKALQSCTSHYLGQNFAEAFNIKFSNKDGELQHAYTSSWGMTTRLIGCLIMCHADDNGLRVPRHIVIIPVIPKDELKDQICQFAENLKSALGEQLFNGEKIVAYIDNRDKRGGEKRWEWVKKGVPLIVEVGPRDVESGSLVYSRRDLMPKEKQTVSVNEFVSSTAKILDEMQQNYFAAAKENLETQTVTDIADFAALVKFFTPKNSSKPEIHGGFVKAKWCGEIESEKLLSEHKLSIRCIPLEQSGTEGPCIITGKPATIDVIIAKSY